MSTLKKWLVITLVVVSLLMTGAGGIMDMLGLSTMRISSAHAWNDGLYLLVLAIFIMIALR